MILELLELLIFSLIGKSFYKHSATLSFSCLAYFYYVGICKLCMGVDVLPLNE